jgi:AAA+ ATPase superfamily predicted ATPase
MNKFINRESELVQLESQYAGNSGSLVVLYGRRRLGKTFLLRHFAEDKPHCYFMADRAGESELRRSLATAMALGNMLRGMIFSRLLIDSAPRINASY